MLQITQAVAWRKRAVAGLSQRRPGFHLKPLRLGLGVNNVALAQVLLRVFRFSPVSIGA